MNPEQTRTETVALIIEAYLQGKTAGRKDALREGAERGMDAERLSWLQTIREHPDFEGVDSVWEAARRIGTLYEDNEFQAPAPSRTSFNVRWPWRWL